MTAHFLRPPIAQSLNEPVSRYLQIIILFTRRRYEGQNRRRETIKPLKDRHFHLGKATHTTCKYTYDII